MIGENKLNLLSKRERLYYDIMKSGNSLYLRGLPGTAKSAIGLSIARKLGVKYMDKRLSQIDETDIGLYPVLKNSLSELEKISKLYKINVIDEEQLNYLKNNLLYNIKIGSDTDSLKFAVPQWAIDANKEPTIIHLEELNRANLHVRNAALQILNERQIGETTFNDNVLIMASGNYGEGDGTEVDEMDLALSNRLCIYDHELKLEEWIEQYAKDNVLPVIVDYLRAKPREFMKQPSKKEIRWASPRSWTNLSKFLIFRYGKSPDIKDDLIPELMEIGKSFIGSSMTEFIRYCQDVSSISVKDIIEKWSEVEKDVSNFNRARLSEIISNLKPIDITRLNDYEINNVILFLKSVWERSGDELTPYLLYLMESINDDNYNVHMKILQNFKERLKVLKEYVNINLKK